MTAKMNKGTRILIALSAALALIPWLCCVLLLSERGRFLWKKSAPLRSK